MKPNEVIEAMSRNVIAMHPIKYRTEKLPNSYSDTYSQYCGSFLAPVGWSYQYGYLAASEIQTGMYNLSQPPSQVFSGTITFTGFFLVNPSKTVYDECGVITFVFEMLIEAGSEQFVLSSANDQHVSPYG